MKFLASMTGYYTAIIEAATKEEAVEKTEQLDMDEWTIEWDNADVMEWLD